MSPAQLLNMMTLPFHVGFQTTLNFEGTWQTAVGKTGLQVTIYDTIGEKVYYKSEFYSGQASYAKDSAYSKSVKWLVPKYIPQSVYEVRIAIINWMNPAEEYGAITCQMEVDDLNN
jgi:hypothetical protein